MSDSVQSLADIHFISEETIVPLLHKNYTEEKYYQKIGQIFCKINSSPNYEIEFQNTLFLNELQKWSKASNDKSLTDKQHIFKFAEEFRRFACDGNKSQCLMLRGISGSGKSDSVKKILQYLSYLDMSFHPEERIHRDFKKPFATYANPFYVTPDASMVSKRMAASITLLDSFYTAPTDHNNSSSRVSSHYKLRYTLNGKLSGFRVDPLFPEFVRCNPKDLYLGPLTIQTIVVNGLSSAALDQHLIPSSLREHYPPLPDFDYTQQLEHLREVVTVYGGLSSDVWDAAIKVIAAVINLQGITLLGTESAIISSSTKSFIGQAEQLLGVESGGLGPAVLKKPDERIGRPAGSVVECKPLEAKYLIEILCAEIMHRLTSFLLNQMSYNYPLTTEKEESPSENHIYSTFHILDPISWDRNCLNQHSSLTTLMNHYCEEKFGELYLVKAFQEEFERYGREGITIEAVTLPEWNIQIDIIERHAGGLIQLLEEACQNPRSEDKSVADKIILNHNKSKLVKSGGAKTKQTVFVIKHSFADISYDCDGFINANKYGQVPPSMSNALKTSKFPFISSEPISPIKLLDAKDGGAAAKVAKPRGDPKGVSPQSYAFYRTKQQIEGLISELQECEKTHYLVCLNLNPFSRQGETPPTDYLSTQIKSLYLEGLIKLAQSGFAYSRPYHDIYRRFRILLPFSNTALPLHITAEVENNYLGFCKNLLKECVMTHKLNQIDPTWETQITYGKNAIFMKEKFAMMLESYRFNYYESSNLSCLLLQSIIRMRKWRKSFLILRRGMIGLQSHLRRKIQRKRYLFNLQSALLVKSLIIVNYRRKRFLRMSKAANIIKKRLLGKAIQRIRYKRLLRAAKSFHALAKGFIVRRHSQNVYDSIRLIQRMAKAYVLRKRIARIRLASALRIQYIFRGYRVRQEHSSFVKVLKVRKEQRIAQRVVEKIQSLWRKKLVMERFQEIVESVVMIQRWLKTCMRRKWFLQLRELVICLQSQWRRLTSSKYVNALKVANMVKQEKESLSDLYYHETSCLKDIYWENGCILSEENRQEKKAAQRIMKLLVCLDFCFDLSLAYNDGWLNTYLTFQRELKNKENRHIKLVNIGNHHTVIVDDKSAVYTMGLGDLGQLGHGHRKSLSYPKKIEKLKSIVTAGYGVVQSLEVKTEIVSVACGKDHTLILTSGGLVFSWGDNRHGQLGHSNFESTAIAKVVVTASDQKPLKNVTQISCGSFHSACIADPGLLYTWGKGELLGTSPHFRHEDEYDTKMSDSCSPSQLPIFHRKKFTQVVCGESHIIALCYGEIYSWGMNQYGQLGLGNTNHQYLPKKIQTIRFHEFDTIHGKLYSGGRHNLFALKGNIWLWGWNKYGQIGDGTTDNALVPVQIDPTKLISKQLPVATTPTALSATASPSLSVARKMFVREDSRGETSLKHTAAPSTNNKGSVLVTSAFLTWRQSMVVTNNKEIFTWGVVNNLLPYTRSMREADEFLANNLPEPFEIMVKPKLLSLDGVSTHYFDGTDMKVSFNQQLVGVHGCSNFALSLLAVEVEAISSTNITQGTTGLNNSITTPIKSSIRANDATLSNSLSKLRVTTAAPTPTNTPGSTSKLKSQTVGLMATSAAAQARKEENDRKDKLKYKTVINKNTKFTKDITFDASSDEVLKRFREEVGRVTLYPGQKKNVTKPVNPKKNESEIPSEESKLNVHESNEGKDGTITKVPIKSTSLLDSVRSTRRVHITNDTQEGEGNDEESSRQPQKEDGSLVELFNPSLLKKMKSLKITQAERLKQLQKELHDQTSFDFTFHSAVNTPGAPSSSPSRSRGSPTRSRGSKYEATGGGSSTSFLQNFLQGTEGATTSTSQWRKGESVSRRFSGSPLSRFVNSKAVTDAEDGPAPAASKKTAGVAIANGGRGTRDSFIWTAGSPTTSSRKARAGSLQGVESQPSQSSVDTTVLKSSDLFGSSATPSSHDKSKRMKLFSPSTSSLLANDPSNPNLSFKEQMHELGYLRKKTTPRFLFSENPSPLFNVDLNKVSQAQTSPPPSYNANPSTPGSGSPNKRDNLSKTGTTTGNTRNSLEKLKRELIYMQQK